jgi:NADH-quinone oxidoreductase subunit M
MFLLLFLLIPITAALLLLFTKKEQTANAIAIGAGLITLVAAVYIIINKTGNFDASWLPILNSRFLLQADGLAKILVLLTAISFPAIFITTQKNQYTQKNIFLSLMLLSLDRKR